MQLFSFVLPFSALAIASPFVPSRSSHSHLSNSSNTLNSSNQATISNWWYANIDRTSPAIRDYAPGAGDDNYQTYKTVSNVNDLYNAILSDGPNGKPRPSYHGSDVQSIIQNDYLASLPRVVYVQPGTYSLNRKLVLTGDTILVGDASNPPILQASSSFTDPYVVQGGSGDLNGNSHGELRFSRMIKNIIIDTTKALGNSNLIALEWGVAQNCALVNIQINMPPEKHTGLFIGQGSTIQVADVSFNSGNIGIQITNQQVTLKNIKLCKTTTGIQINGGFTVNILNPTFDTVGLCIQQTNGQPWLSVVDANVLNSGTLLSTVQYPNFMLENIHRDNNNAMVTNSQGSIIADTKYVGHYVYGNTHGANPIYQQHNQPTEDQRPSTLLVNGKYPVIVPNQHIDKTASQVLNLKDKSQTGNQQAYGDGKHNDGPALQIGLNNAAAAGKIAYLPFGVYRVQDTITIPPGTILFGNGWSTIQGFGSNFKTEANPRPVVQIGQPGSTGTAEIHDIRVDAGEQIPGAILMQVNMAGAPGDVVIHNSLITVGGTADTSIDCSSTNNCAATYIGLHLSTSSSAYINNVWVWVADHSTDNTSKGTNSAAKGGVLVEATKGTWLNGLGSEHFWYYNLGYHDASNVFVSMLQSETNYQQGNSQRGSGPPSDPPPGPFTPTIVDPDWSICNNSSTVCRMTMNQWFNGGNNIISYASASWNFGGADNEQANVNVIQKTPQNLQLYGLCAGPDTNYIIRLQNGTRFGHGALSNDTKPGDTGDGYSGSWQTLVAQLKFELEGY